MQRTYLKSALVMLSLAFSLTACGGGGDSPKTTAPNTPNDNAGNPPPPAVTKQITGMAIDGYLVGAKVCIDLNNNGVCDAGEPSTVTGKSGSYALPYSGDVTGKKLLVLVDNNTSDLSRPNYRFPVSFALTASIDGDTNQHVTPLTTMQQTLMEQGLSKNEAANAVTALAGGSVNWRDDYIAKGDHTAAAFAAAVVDKVGEFAKNGTANADTVRGVLGAIVTKGAVAGITQANVDDEIAKPVVSTDVDAKTVFTNTPYSYLGYGYVDGYRGWAQVRHQYSLSADTLSIKSQARLQPNTPWVDYDLAKIDEFSLIMGKYTITPDGKWSLISEDDLYKPATIKSISGNTVTVIDPITNGIRTLEFRQTNLAGAPINDWTKYSLLFQSRPGQTAPGNFPANAAGVLSIETRDYDQIIFDLWKCGEANWGETIADAIVQDGVTHCSYSGDRNRQYTSIDEIFGVDIRTSPETGYLDKTLNADGTVTVVNTLLGKTAPAGAFTWTRMANNSNVVVIEKDPKFDDRAFVLVDYAVWIQGGKAVVAIHDGRIQSGYLLPKSRSKKVLNINQVALDTFVSTFTYAGLLSNAQQSVTKMRK